MIVTHRFLLKRLVLFTFSLATAVFTLVSLEIGLGVSRYQKRPLAWGWATGEDNRLFSVDDQLIYRMRSSVDDHSPEDLFWASDQFGFRLNPDHLQGRDEASEEIEIVMLGDSFTYGHGVEHQETIPFLLERNLREYGLTVIVHNAGVPGYGPDQEFVYLRDRILPKHHPDTVVWNLTTNDMYDSHYGCLFVPKGGEFEQVNGKRNTLYWLGLVMNSVPKIVRRSDSFNLVLSSLPQRLTIGCSGDYEQYSSVYFSKLTYLVSEMKRLASEQGFSLLITLMPFQRYFDSDKMSESARHFEETIADAVRTGGVEPILLSSEISRGSVLGAADDRLSRSLFIDESPQEKYGRWHLNANGNEATAAALESHLLDYVR